MEKIKVAIADDNEVFLRELGHRISGDGTMNLVGAAKNGEDICRIIRDEMPDVVTLDIIMPRKDGLAVLDTMMKDDKLKKHPSFIMVSAVGKDKIAQEAFELGADYYLRKPVEIPTVISKIRSSYLQSKGKTESMQSFLQEEQGAYMTGEPAGDISAILIDLGIPAHIKGYYYLREAVVEALEHPDYINSVTKHLYPAVAERLDSTSGKVERGIRHAIEVAWSRGKLDRIDRIFGYSTSVRTEKPTNCEFIALLADKLSMEYKNRLSKS